MQTLNIEKEKEKKKAPDMKQWSTQIYKGWPTISKLDFLSSYSLNNTYISNVQKDGLKFT